MNAVIIGLSFLVVLISLPALVRRNSDISPRVAAGAYLVDLLGWALLPAIWVTCLGSALGSWLGGVRTASGGCLLGLNHGQWQLLGYGPGALVFGALLWQGLRHAVSARRSELHRAARVSSVRRSTAAGEVWVVPSNRPMAFASGLWRSRAVVTSGMLISLEGREREAVCEHEAAHVRLGHPRLLIIGGAIASAYGRLPPVRRAWLGLRRALEAAADDEAARTVGVDTLVSALIRVSARVRGTNVEHEGYGVDATVDPELRARVARLTRREPVTPWPTARVAAAAVATAVIVASVGCALAGASASTVGLLGCLAVVTLVGLRPTWSWRAHGTPR